MREHQPRWRILILLLVIVSTSITVLGCLVLGAMDFQGAWIALTNVGLVGLVAWGLWEVFRRRWWRWRMFRGWLVDLPDLNGKWLGVARSNYVDPSSDEPNGEIQVMMEITQTFTSICVGFTALTLTSTSDSITARFVTDPEAKRCRLVYTYLNEPGALAEDLDMHFGTAILNIRGEPPSEMEGSYMTARNQQTRGTLKLKRQTDEILAAPG